MPEGAKQIQLGQNLGAKVDPIDQTILETHTEELVIGLCGPIGTDIKFVSTALKKVLEEQYSYECQIIKLSSLIRLYTKADFPISDGQPEYDRIKKLIEAGNHLRERHDREILAELAINEISVIRQKKQEEREAGGIEKDTYTSIRICYIIDSIKNIYELNLFRLIYRELFYSIGVFSPLEVRKHNLIEKGFNDQQFYELVNRDSGEEKDTGQRVTDTFVISDLFLRFESSSFNLIENKIRRFLHLIFDSDIITPSSSETAMYIAASAAGNSACLSRQVGAAITDKNGEILGVGWNEVPKAGGSVYQYSEDDPLGAHDKRCTNIGGKCFNDYEKKIIAESLIDELISEGLVDSDKKEKIVKLIRNRSKIKDLIEFSRAVHAEMHAMIMASQKAGERVLDGKLYCTTYPCHNCARHLVAAGIKEIYYIEPYRKSLAIKLHHDSITEEESKNQMVRILMFEGVSPTRYLDFFKMIPGSRKKDGSKLVKSSKAVSPKKTLSLQAIPILEKKITENLQKKNLISIDEEAG